VKFTSPDQIKKRVAELAHIREEQQLIRKTNQAKGLNVAGKEILTAKQALAVKNAVAPTKAYMDKAEQVEQLVTKYVKGIQSHDDFPVDVQLKTASGLHGIEVKTLMLQNNDKITMNRGAIGRKLAWAKSNNADLSTVAVDLRGSKVAVYYKSGVGSFRLGSMEKVSGGLKGLASMF
jgi:hypothetical protein